MKTIQETLDEIEQRAGYLPSPAYIAHAREDVPRLVAALRRGYSPYLRSKPRLHGR